MCVCVYFGQPCDSNLESIIMVIRSTGRLRSGRLDNAKSWKKRGGGRTFGAFSMPHVLILRPFNGLNLSRPQRGRLEPKRKERKREKEEREVKEKGVYPLFLVLAERNPERTPRCSTIFKVFPWDFMLQSSIFMCWNINYVDFLFYFMKKVEAFEG